MGLALLKDTVCRYKGLAAGIATCSDAIRSIAEQAGITNVTCLIDSQVLAASQPDLLLNAAAAAERVLTTLGEPLALASQFSVLAYTQIRWC